ncbi:restriction endonuclease subunit S [Erythrobacter sp.]|uniref:restriction endonuclease subunit S n=1 Tax=Erythrobacter sp. TaxID=1042 RepID=UPI0025CFD829|nr:restriction endonuclease subunit S [Erythrobacter sp.]
MNGLLEGLEISIVPNSELEDDSRFDSQFFFKRYLAEHQALHRLNLREIGDIAFVTDGPHGYHVVDEKSPIAMLTASCASDWFAERTGADTIAKWVDDANKRSSLQVDDLILSTRGTVGNCALVTREALPANLDQDVARISLRADSDIRPKYTVAYLNSKFGQDHIARHASGMVQQGLSLAKVRKVPIPVLAANLQAAIAECVDRALEERRNSVASWTKAEDKLLDVLGLGDWAPPEPLTYGARASDAVAAGRLDAQYFRPLFQEVEQRLQATGGAVALRHIVTVNARGRQPQYDDFGLSVINSKHVRTNRVILDNNRTAIEAGSPVQICSGDVLVNGTGVGTIGRAAVYLHDEPALPDNHVTVLRTDKIDPVFLSVFLNSPLGQRQIERYIKGSSGQIELYPHDIAQIVVWDAPDDVQQSVRNSVLSAFDAEHRAKSLLDAAKRAVELAIEDSEDAALAYLASVEGAN